MDKQAPDFTHTSKAGGATAKALSREVVLFAAAQAQTEEDIKQAEEARRVGKQALRNRPSFLQATGGRRMTEALGAKLGLGSGASLEAFGKQEGDKENSSPGEHTDADSQKHPQLPPPPAAPQPPHTAVEE